ncbi:MetQ/NlpA family ABC transporter substrate-binding protein [Halalkalibacter sp. APA_J-10(15)]|uniref:MetQ/NlpA family ABC transporter substrate-binding protein n=1 Tax=unclassified Halalkalibacter TaxID=2893063 RepID=UPI001FF5B7C5|nr:MetQ/NlpA family ABC transporter substrate-binding protein [Halalkalibacter sp. APA_J-10(15)]MCK0472756.1 MetQ/NlpA family ABC transporter substrate-binding protein [Halalkalibacter sp. APA_J-10(15)]
MKKVAGLIAALGLSVTLAACGNGADEDSLETLRVGASAVPHTEILEAAAPILEEKGIELDITTFSDYILPNEALLENEIDVNYFQTPGYLASQMDENEAYDFVSIGEIHYEPIGVYSKEYSSLDELPDGATIIISDSISDHGRILPIFERAGLIELNIEDGELARVENIVSNPKDLKFDEYQVEARMLAPSFENDEGDAVVINTNYALEGGVDIDAYGIAFEGEDVLQPNLLVVREGNEEGELVQALYEVLTSEEIREFIYEQYDGAVIPVQN